ncbi:unnamed protein product [Miscanthus lutarioriparius]|uniref:Uncharacterized protein n=1 Tax=Miscanthus lutarioriparius TaxID=422564 RepID=A0A811RHD8_9POAL|nr:unnamed protein product [Miscanthus lutarioriparius]
MPTSALKRPSSGGGRLRRLLASLLPPARAGPLPVQTGFPTSLADIVVKNHGRLRNPRRRHRAPGADPPPTAATEPVLVVPQQRRELSVDHDVATAVAAAGAPVPARPVKGTAFSIRSGLVAAGDAVALALLVIWSKQLVAVATLALVALSWIESIRSARPRRSKMKEEVDSRCGRGRGSVSPIREAAESPRLSCGECESDNGGSDAASLCSPDAGSGDLGCDDTSSSLNNPKESRRSLQKLKLLANKLRNGKTPRGRDSRHGGEAGEHEHPETPRRLNAEPAAAAVAPAEETPAPPLEAITVNDEDRCHRRRGGALPLPALVPIILAGLVAGKLPALALAVLCAAFSSSVERVPAGQASR